MESDRSAQWYRVAAEDQPGEGRVRTVSVGGHSVALSRCGDRFGALANHCPHQGGPLGEGSIENGWLRCPWHGYDFDPISGKPPAGFDDGVATYEVRQDDSGLYVKVPEPVAPPRSMADAVVETLVNYGVTHVFGMVGHSNLGFADAMRRAEERGELTYIGIRHEGAAAFAAAAYGKLTGRPAACFAIAGPGSTNLLTGLYDAKLDGAPVVAISGQVRSKVRGRGAFQDLDLNTVFRDVAAWTTTLAADSDPAELAALAVKRAIDLRGVTHLVLPDEVQPQPSDRLAGVPADRLLPRRTAPDAATLARAASLIFTARRPVLIAGHGARGATAELRTLAELLNCPILTTFKAKGLVPEGPPLGAGVLGRSGTPVASWLMNESDLLIVVGASFSDHTGIATYKPIVSIDDTRAGVERWNAATVGILGDAALTLERVAKLLRAAPERLAAVDQRPDIAARWAIWRTEKERRANDDRGQGVPAAAVFAALSAHLPADAVVTVDVGNHAYSLGRYLESSGQPVLMSGYLGSIGFGSPAALGAWAAAPDRPVVAVTGDGGFAQYAAEITTAVKYSIPIKHILLDNGSLGKISKEQRAADYPVWHTALHNPDWAEYAELCGAKGIRVTQRDQLDAAMTELFAADGPALLCVAQDAELV
ncbi:thiamine pyrophosphate-binding protein [Nocardia seriolae]|uniref:thiamine pyrophosphate-binding protein n=1 Tax=Nocardia seriolae TaxID=37332 RepID=UPI0008FF70C6|nr:thiamine pyrophosphate-binding protein [Nocardia seriolae]OJF82145.1 pyruvate oxidase [Nocardia seriolae]PSK27903.1 pyruvate oxidase [Nocardia seriolae]QOW33764.1 Rieske 2Fe-2S domain-containing protein [Nocardia seriolae]QUN14887.1 Rieske 2Fe-2S domain-containing protein [Nocardia seriolae]WNJ60950.1 thiamine pyrophosphate-binding protein [Nocardia seriolae]